MIEEKKILELIDSDRFSELFIDELGWNRPVAQQMEFSIGAERFNLIPVASYKGIQVWSCNQIPNLRIQRAIDKEIAKISAERLTIFHNKQLQNWRWPMSRESTGNGIVRLVNHDHIKGQRTLSLVQRLLAISIPMNQEPPGLVEMLLRLRRAFDADQITKRFYREFSGYQKKIVNDVEGLENLSDREWYSSLILNRIMFIYFMQWKGFMDGNQNYLGDRLQKIKQIEGPNKFFGFFRDFLLPLFHKGLGAGEEITVPPEIAQIIGQIPYINGGIFSEHELEVRNEIDIPDKTFEEIFEFFDTYQWHLDSRPTGNPNEINPDVLGYVFEQFVNNKEKGAYYTREDITDYMTSNAVVIKLLEKIQNECDINILLPIVQNPERYIWKSIKFGEGLGEVSDKTSDYSFMEKKAFEDYGLPGETNWEFSTRIEYLDGLRRRLGNGEIDNLGELASLNIDLETLIVDLIDGLDTPEDVIRIWSALSSLKIVDPTCGSGAFLFSALGLLEHIYSVLLDVGDTHSKTSKNKDLRALLDEIANHPNRQYFILKHATQKNLFGVDIMKEATEIARLRLFLKLISAIEKFEDIEPLPDLEFNIKSGNLLIGITKGEKLADSLNTLDASTIMEDIFTKRDHLADLWDNFLSAQELGHQQTIKAKKLLHNGTIILRNKLDELFFENSRFVDKQTFKKWHQTSTPFHWFIEFPEVFQNDGFDVVIGNPPYIAKNKVNYSLDGHRTSDCPDIYAMCMERASEITRVDGTFAMIVMSNLAFSSRYTSLRQVLSQKFQTRFVSGFAKIPAALFEGVRVRNAIFIGMNFGQALYSAPLQRWIQSFRPHLMTSIRYSQVPKQLDQIEAWPFVTSSKILKVFADSRSSLRSNALPRGPELTIRGSDIRWDESLGKMKPLFFQGSAYNRISVSILPPPVEDLEGNFSETSMQKVLWIRDEESRNLIFSLFLSKWMFAWWAMYGDDFHVTQENLLSIPIDISRIRSKSKKRLMELSEEVHKEMTKNLKWKKNAGLRIGSWDLSNCGRLLLEIDKIWSFELGVPNLVPDINAAYFNTVKTAIDSEPEGTTED